MKYIAIIAIIVACAMIYWGFTKSNQIDAAFHFRQPQIDSLNVIITKMKTERLSMKDPNILIKSYLKENRQHFAIIRCLQEERDSASRLSLFSIN